MLSIPIVKEYRVINTDIFRPEAELKVIPELTIIKQLKDRCVLYSPLSLRIYLLSKNDYDKLINNRANSEERKLFFDHDLLILKDTDPYERINPNSLKPVFLLTEKCNFNCIYCYSRGGEGDKELDFEGIKTLFDFCIESSKGEKKEDVTFFATGEPTLAFDSLKKSYAYINNSNESGVRATLTSNGTFPRKVADRIIENNIELQISCDGPPQVHDIQKPTKNGSDPSKMVTENIKYFLKKDFSFKVHTTITQQSVNKMAEILNYFHRLGVKGVGFAEMFTMGRATKDMAVNMEDYVPKIMKTIELADTYEIDFFTNMICGKHNSRYCGAGNILILFENGTIGACHRPSDFFNIGKYDKKTNSIIIDDEKRKLIALRTGLDIKKCKECVLKWNCGGGCHFDAYHINNDLFETDTRCDARILAFNNLTDYKIQREYFKIKPALEVDGNDLYYSMIFNRFKLSKPDNNKAKPNSYIEITGKTNLTALLKNIIKARNSNGYNTSLFLMSLNISEKYLNRDYGNKVANFLSELKRNRVVFIITKPICRQIFGAKYEQISKDYNIPKNWFESLEFFRLESGKAILRSGESVDIDENTKRTDLCIDSSNVKENEPPFNKCRFCVHGIRRNCGFRFT